MILSLVSASISVPNFTFWRLKEKNATLVFSKGLAFEWWWNLSENRNNRLWIGTENKTGEWKEKCPLASNS